MHVFGSTPLHFGDKVNPVNSVYGFSSLALIKHNECVSAVKRKITAKLKRKNIHYVFDIKS